jgi:hypothetical protein
LGLLDFNRQLEVLAKTRKRGNWKSRRSLIKPILFRWVFMLLVKT